MAIISTVVQHASEAVPVAAETAADVGAKIGDDPFGLFGIRRGQSQIRRPKIGKRQRAPKSLRLHEMKLIALSWNQLALLASLNANKLDHRGGIVLANGLCNGKRGIDMSRASATR